MGKKKSGEQPSKVTMDLVTKVKNKSMGDGTITHGTKIKKMVPRITTGIHAMTFATGGGYPIHRMTRLKGKESGGKSTTAIQAMKMVKMTCFGCFNMLDYCTCSEGSLEMKSALGDIEGTYDPEWGECIGVENDDCYLVNADDGGSALSVLDTFLQADDCGLVIIDSIAMLMPPDAIDRDFGDYKMASHALFVKDVANKLTNRLNAEKRRGHPCFVIATNQIRYKVGVSFGNPEIEAGGQSFKHWFSLGLNMNQVRNKQKNSKYIDEDRSLLMAQLHHFTIDKEKVWIASGDGEFVRCREDIRSKKDPNIVLFKKGMVVDFKLVFDDMLTYKLLEKKKNGYTIPVFGEGVKETQSGIIRLLKSNEMLYYQVQKEIVERERLRILGEFECAVVEDKPKKKKKKDEEPPESDE